MNVAQANPSLSHTVGNVCFFVMEFLKKNFGEGYFQHTHIASRLVTREFKDAEASNLGKYNFIHKNRPILAIKPNVIIGDDDIFLSGTLLTANINGIQYGQGTSNYMPILRDNVKDISLSYLLNRIRVQFDVMILVDTENEQLNQYSMLRNCYNDNQVYWAKTALEVLVPRNVIYEISRLSGNPIRDENGSVRGFLNYLNSISVYNFTFKEKNSSSHEEFFIYYPLTMEYVFTDFSKPDPEKSDSIPHSCAINFTFTTEFFTVGMYQLSTESDNVKLRLNEQRTTSINDETIIQYYTVNNLFNEADDEGRKMFYTCMFNIDEMVPDREPDVFDLEPLFKDTKLDDILAYHKKHGISNNQLFNIIILKNNQPLNSKVTFVDGKKIGMDFKVDYEKKKIFIFNKAIGATYRLIIYYNNLYLNNLIADLNDYATKYEKEDCEETK